MSELKEITKMKVVQLQEQTPKLGQNQMSEQKDTKEIKVVQLHEQT